MVSGMARCQLGHYRSPRPSHPPEGKGDTSFRGGRVERESLFTAEPRRRLLSCPVDGRSFASLSFFAHGFKSWGTVRREGKRE